jgi:hypothetical protein
MKQKLFLLAALVITFAACNNNEPSGEGSVGGISTKMSDYVGTWDIKGDNSFIATDSKLLCVQLNADTSCYFVVDDIHRGIVVYHGYEEAWEIDVLHPEEEVNLVFRGGCGNGWAILSYIVTKVEPNKISFENRGYEVTNTYFVRTSADTMTDYINKYGDND